ncbi:restriction endonuclease subunit S [Desulfocurvibacter africanus]|uniref:restriction endonuclease subunit S n=1 Tax=Desulfocurvibacter africanus TaxID=873 RepID=UPI002FDADF1E
MVEELLGPLPVGWKYLTLGDACSLGSGNIQTGPFGSQLHASDYVSSGIPSIMPQNIGDNRVIESGIARITQRDAERLARYRVQSGDIIYSRRGDVERRALIRERENGWLCGTGCLRVRFGSGFVVPEYAAFYLGHPRVREWIVRHAHGATMPNLNTSILSACPFVFPSAHEQRLIASILGAFDDKIDLNRRMNETLEAMARAIFKDWFVDFGPTRAKMEGREPYLARDIWDLFPNALDAEAKPEGWTRGVLGDIATSPRTGVQPSEVDPETPYIGLEHMPRRCIALYDWEGAGKVSSAKCPFGHGDFLFGKLRPYFHKVGVAAVDGICSTDIVVVKPIEHAWRAFTIACISTDDFVSYTDRTSTGTKMPRTSWTAMASYELFQPTFGVARAFDDFCWPLIEHILSNIQESRTLVQTRDLLLPKLMSGEIHLKAAENAVENALCLPVLHDEGKV